METGQFFAAVAVGLGATAFMDIVALFLKRVFRVPSANYCFVGRWFLHMPDGKLMHANIGSAPQKRLECPVGWAAHYLIGALYALIFVAVLSESWLVRPTLLPATLYGVGTVLVPFLAMQPSFGLGIAASRAPNPTQARFRSLLAHTVFGIGLYVVAILVSYALPGFS